MSTKITGYAVVYGNTTAGINCKHLVLNFIYDGYVYGYLYTLKVMILHSIMVAIATGHLFPCYNDRILEFVNCSARDIYETKPT